MDRVITEDNPLERYGLIRPELPQPPGEILLRVHENSTRRDATFYIDPGGEENVAVLSRPIFITMILMCRNGRHVWTGDMEWRGLTDGRHFMTVGHPGHTLPNAGDYGLRFTPRLEAVQIMAAAEDLRAEHAHQQDTLRHWSRWLEKLGRKRPGALRLSSLGTRFATRSRAAEVLRELRAVTRDNPWAVCAVSMDGAGTAPGFIDELVRGAQELAERNGRPISISARAGHQLELARAARDRRKANMLQVYASPGSRRTAEEERGK